MDQVHPKLHRSGALDEGSEHIDGAHCGEQYLAHCVPIHGGNTQEHLASGGRVLNGRERSTVQQLTVDDIHHQRLVVGRPDHIAVSGVNKVLLDELEGALRSPGPTQGVLPPDLVAGVLPTAQIPPGHGGHRRGPRRASTVQGIQAG